jgi:ariadne-1
MVCAAPWKTCNCPWFNYTTLDDDDRLEEMRVPYNTRDDVVEVIEFHDDGAPPPTRRASTRARHRPDRELDRADEALAAHLRAQLRLQPGPTASEAHRSDATHPVYGVGNSGGHHMNDSYTVRPLANTAARAAARMSTPRTSFFGRRMVRDPPRATPPKAVTASAMAGLSRDGSKRGQNRVGTWLSHVTIDNEAIQTAPTGVDYDDNWFKMRGSVVGID